MLSDERHFRPIAELAIAGAEENPVEQRRKTEPTNRRQKNDVATSLLGARMIHANPKRVGEGEWAMWSRTGIVPGRSLGPQSLVGHPAVAGANV